MAFSNVYHSACVWPTALKRGCVTNFDKLFLEVGFISLVDEIKFMLISSRHICIRSRYDYGILHKTGHMTGYHCGRYAFLWQYRRIFLACEQMALYIYSIILESILSKQRIWKSRKTVLSQRGYEVFEILMAGLGGWGGGKVTLRVEPPYSPLLTLPSHFLGGRVRRFCSQGKAR